MKRRPQPDVSRLPNWYTNPDTVADSDMYWDWWLCGYTAIPWFRHLEFRPVQA